MKILINALIAKKKSGGGYQIAVNFIRATITRPDISWFYFVSEDINDLIKEDFINKKNITYFVFQTQPDFFNTYWKVRKQIKGLESSILPDIIYSVNAPSYFKFNAPEVIRFANAWVTNPNKYAKKTLSYAEKVRTYLYCYNQRRLMKKRMYFITQSETVKDGIIKITHTLSRHVEVIPNVLPAIYQQKNNISNNIQNNEYINIACIAAPYKHKNIEIIPYILKELEEKYNTKNIVFHITVPSSHTIYKLIKKQSKKYGFEKRIINHEYCNQAELINIYSQCDFALLPSLLETFSASILEAMYFNLPIIATDFNFNKEIAGDCALYFPPMDYRSAASKIICLINNPAKRTSLINNMPLKLQNYSSYDHHINNTIDFLKRVINK